MKFVFNLVFKVNCPKAKLGLVRSLASPNFASTIKLFFISFHFRKQKASSNRDY